MLLIFNIWCITIIYPQNTSQNQALYSRGVVTFHTFRWLNPIMEQEKKGRAQKAQELKTKFHITSVDWSLDWESGDWGFVSVSATL